MGGFIPDKKITLLFLLVSVVLFSTSCFAGRVSKSMVSITDHHEEIEMWKALRHDEESDIHERVLRVVKTNDYGRYDPTPALVKPPFKLIPN